MADPTFFSKEILIDQFECDAHDRMTPGAILRQAQQISTDHFDAIYGSEKMRREKHCAFLLAKLAMELRAPIRSGRCITIVTRPSAPQRAVYHRCTTLSDESGAVLCVIDSRWVLVDLDAKRILRRPPEDFTSLFTQGPAFELPIAVSRDAAAGAKVCARERASYTRCDINRHLNNTFYADIVLDHLPVDRLDACAPARLTLLYHNEIPLGTEFSLRRADMGGDAWYFCGEDTDAGKKFFEAQIELAH